MKTTSIQFDPGVAGQSNPLKWAVLDKNEEAVARFAHRDDAELFEAIITRRPHRALTRELRP